MFESLYKIRAYPNLSEGELARAANAGDGHAADALTTLRNIKHFALWPDLGRLGCDPQDWRGVLDAMLSPSLLAVGQRAKGLIPFHAYGSIARTAVEEHCRCNLALGVGKIHFTIKPNAVDDLVRATTLASPGPGSGRTLNVSHSFQRSATDTICLAEDGSICRNGGGDIVFRAGGHGSLLSNLMETGGDIVFLRNIDSIVVEEKFPIINNVRSRMCEHLLALEEKIHSALRKAINEGVVSDALEVITKDLGLKTPDSEQSVKYYVELLNRPIRVCGVIRAKGDVGGGLYWVRGPSSVSQVQIVEDAQLSYSNNQQRKIAKSLAYFNPVDMVCSIRDFNGSPFNLTDFRDDEAFIITKKSENGQLRWAYEHPGLWNGGMARWNSVFVEVPAETFQPVKRFSDLLGSFHRNDM